MKKAEKIILIIILSAIFLFTIFLISLTVNSENINGISSVTSNTDSKIYSAMEEAEPISSSEETHEPSSDTSHNIVSNSSLSPSSQNNKISSSDKPSSLSQKPTSSVTSSVTSNSKMVWVTKTGKKYHRISNCGNAKSAIQVTQKDAETLGLAPCGNCW